MKWICATLLILIVINKKEVGATEVLRSEPLSMQVEKTDQLVVQGYNGRVILYPRPDATSLTVRFTQMPAPIVDAKAQLADLFHFSMERNAGRVILRVSGPSEKELMRQSLLSASQPRFLLEIASPPLPAQVHWWVGEVNVKGWSRDLTVNLLDGKVVSDGGSGPLRLYLDRGEAQIADHKGDVDVETYSGRIELNKIAGDVSVDNFRGSSQIEKVLGRVRMVSFQAPGRATEVKGGLEYEAEEGALSLERIEGPLVGRNDRGAVKASLVGTPQVRMESNQGSVRLQAAGSGADVNVGSVEGRLQVPRELERVRLPDLEVRQGRLKGPPGGSIFVRTQSGAIQIH